MIIPILALCIPILAIGAVIVFILMIGRLFRPAPSTADEHLAAEMIAAMERMETRITTLERILDAEDPKWRTRL